MKNNTTITTNQNTSPKKAMQYWQRNPVSDS